VCRRAAVEILLIDLLQQVASRRPFEVHAARNVAALRDVLGPGLAAVAGDGELSALSVDVSDAHPPEPVELVDLKLGWHRCISRPQPPWPMISRPPPV
jgi:hypothetical protein